MTSTATKITTQTTRKDSDIEYNTTNGVPVDGERQKETAQYIADIALELRNMARAVHLQQMMLPLELVYYQAFGAANPVDVPDGEAERIERLSQAVKHEMSDG